MVCGETFFAAGCIATDLRGCGPLDVGECAAPMGEGPLRGCSAVDLRGGGPRYASGGLTPRKGGVVLASATSFSPHLVCSVSSQPIISLSLSLRYIRIIYYIDSGLCERAAVRIARSRLGSAGRAEENVIICILEV